MGNYTGGLLNPHVERTVNRASGKPPCSVGVPSNTFDRSVRVEGRDLWGVGVSERIDWNSRPAM